MASGGAREAQASRAGSFHTRAMPPWLLLACAALAAPARPLARQAPRLVLSGGLYVPAPAIAPAPSLAAWRAAAAGRPAAELDLAARFDGSRLIQPDAGPVAAPALPPGAERAVALIARARTLGEMHEGLAAATEAVEEGLPWR